MSAGVYKLSDFNVVFETFQIEVDRDARPSTSKEILLEEKEPVPWFKEDSYYFSIDDLTERMTGSVHMAIEVQSVNWNEDNAFVEITPQEAMNLLCKWGNTRLKEMK